VEEPAGDALQQEVAPAPGRLAARVRHAAGHLHPAWPVAMVTARHEVRTLEQHGGAHHHRRLLANDADNTPGARFSKLLKIFQVLPKIFLSFENQHCRNFFLRSS